MNKRQNPTLLPNEEFQRRLEYLRDFVGAKWLQKRHGKPRLFKLLWERRDFLASIELFTIAEALQKFDVPEFGEWINEYKNILRRDDGDLLISKTHEIVSASMFYNQGQSVALCPPSNPVYDFTVQTGADVLWVSAKRILETDKGKSFHVTCDKLYDCLRDCMRLLKVNALKTHIWFTDIAPPSTESLADGKFFYESLSDYKRCPRNHIYEDGPYRWQYYALELPPDQPNLSFYPHRNSLVLICVAPFLGNEQKRFEDNFRRAANKIKKSVQSGQEKNMILFGLPTSVSISQATEWLIGKFSREHKSIGGVLFIRKVPVVSAEKNSTAVSIEWDFVSNPESPQKMEIGLKLEVPIGVVRKQESTTAFVVDGAIQLLTNNCYSFQKGQIFYDNKDGRLGCELTRIPGVDLNIVVSPIQDKAVSVNLIHPPRDNLVLI